MRAKAAPMKKVRRIPIMAMLTYVIMVNMKRKRFIIIPARALPGSDDEVAIPDHVA
jgi:hypothetical protein